MNKHSSRVTSQPKDAAAAIRARARGFAPRLGIVLGSGLGPIGEAIEQATILSYADVPGFPQPGVEGHAGKLVLGKLGGLPVACLQGRVHMYEGRGAEPVKMLVRTLKLLGCESLLLTNAAGSLRKEVGAGSLMLLSDHINLQGISPLSGANEDEFGPRFPAMENAYDADLRKIMRDVAGRAGIALAEGVYAAILGPCFETPAEIRMLSRLGADAVGMSTVPETIVARHCGLRVAAVSVITNLGAGMGEPLSHEQTLREAAGAAQRLRQLMTGFCEALADGR
ncbi:MAG TPA: purine-nucleoside phosphorylase [Dongiaceae bacterium]|jgi:xanthosine phosphorylase